MRFNCKLHHTVEKVLYSLNKCMGDLDIINYYTCFILQGIIDDWFRAKLSNSDLVLIAVILLCPVGLQIIFYEV